MPVRPQLVILQEYNPRETLIQSQSQILQDYT